MPRPCWFAPSSPSCSTRSRTRRCTTPCRAWSRTGWRGRTNDPLPSPPHKGEGVLLWLGHLPSPCTRLHLPPCGGGREGGAMSFDLAAVRAAFPILAEKIHDHRLAYLDTGASAQ